MTDQTKRTYMKLSHPKDGIVLVGIEGDTIVEGEGWAVVLVGKRADDTLSRLARVSRVKVEKFDG